MLFGVFQDLDRWVAAANRDADEAGLTSFRRATIRVLGQTALLASDTGLTLVATQDVDVYSDCEWAVRKELERLLAAQHQVLDPHGEEVWMPAETEYDLVFDGTWVRGFVAQPDFVLISKALKAPDKNRALVVEYLAQGASPRFMQLADEYDVDLEAFL